jgi:hypothetical protein
MKRSKLITLAYTTLVFLLITLLAVQENELVKSNLEISLLKRYFQLKVKF